MKSANWNWRIGFAVAVSVGMALALPPGLVDAQAAAKRRPIKSKKKLKREERFSKKKDYELDDEVKAITGLKLGEEIEGKKPDLDLPEEPGIQLETLLEAKLDEEIDLAQRLLELETACGEGPKVRFRLADLYWEKSKREFFRGNDFGLAEAVQTAALKSMVELQEKAVQSYQFIIDQCPGYSDLSRVHYELGKTLVEMDRPQEGAAHFKRIIDDYADSDWIANAWFMVGEYYFNTESRADQALKAYQRVREFSELGVYPYAVFKEGWCHINMGNWDLALERFQQVADHAKASKSLTDSERNALIKATLKDFVRAYAHLDPRYSKGGVGGAKKAYSLFRKMGGRQEAIRMMELLGNWYVNWDAHYDVVTIYKSLIKNIPQSSRQPIYRARLIYAHNQIGNLKAATQEIKKLGPALKRVLARRDRQEESSAVADGIERDARQAIEISEKTVRQIVLEGHEVAKKLRGKAQRRKYGYVKNLYGQYLSIFSDLKAELPINYEFFMRFYFAEVLFQQGDFLKAARNYDAVVALNSNPETGRERKLLEAAAEEAVRAYDDHVAMSERRKPMKIKGTKPRAIPPVKRDLIAACERYISLIGGKGDKIVPIRYKVARVYYSYNHFDKAAPAFDDIVKNHPESDVACYSANLTLDIYNGLKDFTSLRDVAFAYIENAKLSCGEIERNAIRTIGEKAAFKVIKTSLEDTKKYVEAASAYSDYQERFPKGEFADDAVYNAAVNFGLSGQENKAQKMRELLVQRYPESGLVPDTLFSMGASADRLLDFEDAASRFELFAQRYPKDKRARDALFNAGIYWDATGNKGRSMKNRQRLLKQFPQDPMAATLALGICEEMELTVKLRDAEVGPNRSREVNRSILNEWEAAHNCFFDFIRNKNYVKNAPELLCVAQHRRGEIMRVGTRYAKGVEQIGAYLSRNWARWKSKSRTMPRCSRIMAEKEFNSAEKQFKVFEQLRLDKLDPTSDRTIKRFQASLKGKIKKRDELIERMREIVEIGVGTWALAAVVRIGDAHRNVMDKVLNARIPSGLSLQPEDIALVREELKRQAQPILVEAIAAYELCLQKAGEWGVYNSWSKKARIQLQRLAPETYPAISPESPLVLSLPVATEVRDSTAFEFKVLNNDDWKSMALRFGVRPKPVPSPGTLPQTEAPDVP